MKQFDKEAQWLLKEKYNNKVTKSFKKDLRRLKKGEPVDYVIGFKEFLGCKIDLSKKPLIPRPETEYWAAKAIDEIKASAYKLQGFEKTKIRALDIFAGSGCIGIAVLANTLEFSNIILCDFADNDAKAISQIKINIKNNFIRKGKYNIIKSDIFSKVKAKYDFILANPPYIPATRKKKVDKSVLKYEPRQALFGGKDGLKYIKKFLSEAKKHLAPDGIIFMEHDSIQQKGIEKLLKKHKYNSWKFYKDQYGKQRWVVVK